MSHYTVLVIGNEVEEQLAPYHEFECTGVNDQYVQEIDQTEEARADYEKETTRRYKSPDGVLHDPYTHKFYRDPTPEEKKEIGVLAGTGGNGEISWDSRDWHDGRGYRTKIHFMPEGWEEVRVLMSEQKTFAEFIDYNYNRKTVGYHEAPDISGEHKYGYTLLGPDGEVLKTIDRTNPNKKWDWYEIGGRWNGFFKVKPGVRSRLGKPSSLALMDRDYEAPGADRADQCLKGDLDVQGMRQEAAEKAGVDYDLFTSVTKDHPVIVSWEDMRAKHEDNIGSARTEYHEQPGVKALRENKDTVWFEPEKFACSREEYVDRARNNALRTFAVVKDGQWFERGKMGWWGVVIDEKDDAEWGKQFSALIDGLSDDTLLTVVDCHI